MKEDQKHESKTDESYENIFHKKMYKMAHMLYRKYIQI